jgi:hypothetical protein
MPSMVSANRFISRAVIPLVILAYGVFLLIDHGHNRAFELAITRSIQRDYVQTDHTPTEHIQNIQKIGSINGLLFGGSNAAYSLSAGFLSYYTGMTWYNASLNAELGNIKRHKNFIQDLSAEIDRTKVRYVVYSSYIPYEKKVAGFESRANRGITIKPKISILGYIRHHRFPNSEQRDRFGDKNKRDRFGDKIFENVNCRFTADDPVSHQRENVDISAEFLADYAIFFASLFPNASILIVLPSEYYGALSFDDSIFEQTLRTKFYSILNARYFKDTNMKIIFQPPYTSIKQLCDEQYHANEDGRVWRTRNLIEFMREAVVR